MNTMFPEDPMTPTQTLTAEVHELFTAYCQVGFSEDQALDLVKVHLSVTLTYL